MRFRGLLAGIAATLAAASPAMAQHAGAKWETPTRSGFFFSMGLGMGSAGASCDGCSSERDNGFSGYLRAGGTLNPHLRLGAESNGWLKNSAGVEERVGFLSGVAFYYPSVQTNFWVKGGVGYAHASLTEDRQELSTNGLGLSLGAGYDWQVGSRFAVSPYMNYLRQVTGEAALNGTGLGIDLTANLLQFGVGFGYQR